MRLQYLICKTMKRNLINILTVFLLGLGLFLKPGASVLKEKISLPFDNNLVSVLSISLRDSALVLNDNEVLTRFRFNDSLGLFEPGSREVWYKQLKQLLGYGYFDTDSLVWEQTALIQLRLPGHPDKRDSTTVFNEIIRLLQKEGTLLYILKDRFIVRGKEAADSGLNRVGSGLGILALIGIFLLNNFRRTSYKKGKSPDDFEEEVPIYKEEEEVSECVLPEALTLYADKFIEKYGDLYERIEALPFEPEEKDREVILKMMVEMAIHAHSFHKIGRQNRWETLNESPNARLLTGKVADPAKLSAFSAHPEEMDRKFRFLVRIVKGLKINSLEVYLRDEVVVGPDDLK